MARLIEILQAFDRALMRVEVALVSAALLLMVVLKFADVVMRNTGHGGVPEFATIAQHLVVWAGMLGASLATADRRHISIEVFTPLVTPQGRRVVEGIVDVATIFVCALLTYVAWSWIVFSERPEKTVIFTIPLAGVPFRRWWSLTIIPVGFGLIGFRFLRLALERIFVDEPVDREAEVRHEVEEFDRRLASDERAGAGGEPTP